MRKLIIGDLEVKIPIIQGGMGVGVSLSSLAGAVAKEGGIGIISAAQVGYRESDFKTNTKEANLRALKKEIKRAKEISNNGIIGVNVMVAQNYYEDLVKTAVEGGADIIISGAGLPADLPKLTKGTGVKIAPIVSSAKAARIICKIWLNRYDYIPDFIVIEGPKAGGHLGFKMDELLEGREEALEDIVKDVLKDVKEDKIKGNIPVIAAGGIYTSSDIKKFLDLGASGVQMATRFICTDECDADIKFKEAFLNCKKEDMTLIKSPVGMPGRAIKNEFIKSISGSTRRIKKCFGCLKSIKCNPANTVYCITEALINAVRGDIDNAVIFSGSNGYRMDKIVTVKELLEELTKDL